MFVSQQKPYVEALIPNLMAFGDWAVGGQLGLEEVMRVGPYDGFNAFKRKDGHQSLLALFLCNGSPQQDGKHL